MAAEHAAAEPWPTSDWTINSREWMLSVGLEPVRISAAPATAVHALRADAPTFSPRQHLEAQQPKADTDAKAKTRRRWHAGHRRMVNDLVGSAITDGDELDAIASGVEQQYSVTTMDMQLSVLYALLLRRLRDAPAVSNAPKSVIVYCQTVRLTKFYADCFDKAGWPVLSVHSNVPAAVQEQIHESFSRGGGVLFASDVVSTGAVYEATVQVGLPSSVSAYRRRLVQCAAGGTYHLLLYDFEVPCALRELAPGLQRDPLGVPQLTELEEGRLRSALAGRPLEWTTEVYRSWLGYYNSHLKRLEWTREELVRRADLFAVEALNLPSAPALEPKMVGMMALKGVAGLRVVPAPPQQPTATRSAGGRARGDASGSGRGSRR